MYWAKVYHYVALLCLLVVAACQSIPSGPPPTITLLPTADSRSIEQLCAEIDAAWGHNWESVILLLNFVQQKKGTCSGKDPTQLLYPAYYNYGVYLEQRSQIREAITAFQQAHNILPSGKEAVQALQRYHALTPAPLPVCTSDLAATALANIPLYQPVMHTNFIKVTGDQFTLDGQRFAVRGVNYYPMRAPWYRFLQETDLANAARELDLIQAAGMNTIRIFVWYDALFECSGSGVVPRQDAFVRLDGVIKLAAERNLRLIVTLNDLPDLDVRPLYNGTSTATRYTSYVVTRYREEPAILAWDLRNEPDIDITRYGQTTRAVVDWLRETGVQVRRLDSNHLITIGWLENPLVGADIVDFLSFHHWSDAGKLVGRVTDFRQASTKPLLIEEVGYSSWGNNELRQSNGLQQVLSYAEQHGLAGWLVWTAFDFPTDVTCVPPACPSKDNGEHHFGLWYTDYTPKAALAVVQYFTNQP